jgi:hypothetical protein
MRTRWGAGLVGVALVALGFGPAVPAQAVERTVTHHLIVEGFATPSGIPGASDVFAGRALQDDGYNRNVTYVGTTTTYDYGPPYCHWVSGTFKLLDRDRSTLTVEIVPDWDMDCYGFPTTEVRSQDVVVTEGTGRFQGVTGTGHVELSGSPVRLEGDLVLMLSS